MVFQSTLSSRRATPAVHPKLPRWRYFNPRSPHGERLLASGGSTVGSIISIHALLTESDQMGELASTFWRFQSTLSSRRATRPLRPARRGAGFQSTLSSRRATSSCTRQPPTTGFQSTLSSRRATARDFDALPEDVFQSTLSSRRATSTPPDTDKLRRYFNPRSPHGERRSGNKTLTGQFLQFQSTLSSRRATQSRRIRDHPRFYFNPRSPHGERPVPAGYSVGVETISIHALLTESDLIRDVVGRSIPISIHALLTESDCLQR